MKKHLEKLDSVKGIKSSIHKLEKRLFHIQEKCKHEKVKKTYHSDTGNFDPSYDHYRTDFHCLFCDKRWSEEGTK